MAEAIVGVVSQSSLLQVGFSNRIPSGGGYLRLAAVRDHRLQFRGCAAAGGVFSGSTAPISPVITGSAEEEDGIEVETGGGGGDQFGDNSGGGGGDGDKNGGGGDKGDEGEDEDEDFEDESKKKLGMSMSQKLTLGFAALVGLGGFMGYMKSGSQKSLLAGGISASLLLFVFTQLPTRPALASSIGLGISAALLYVMGSRFKRSGKVFPAGVVSLVSLVMTGGYLHGIMRSLH